MVVVLVLLAARFSFGLHIGCETGEVEEWVFTEWEASKSERRRWVSEGRKEPAVTGSFGGRLPSVTQSSWDRKLWQPPDDAARVATAVLLWPCSCCDCCCGLFICIMSLCCSYCCVLVVDIVCKCVCAHAPLALRKLGIVLSLVLDLPIS